MMLYSGAIKYYHALQWCCKKLCQKQRKHGEKFLSIREQSTQRSRNRDHYCTLLPLPFDSFKFLWSQVSLDRLTLIALCTFIPFTSYTSKPSECQAKDLPGSNYSRTNITRLIVSWLDIPNDTPPSHCQPENWLVKNITPQARKVHFPADHQTSRNQKQALRKSRALILYV